MEVDWAAPADWKYRSAAFRDLRTHQGRLVMECVTPVSRELRHEWHGLPQHPNLFRLVAPYAEGVLLNYAAINWSHQVISVETRAARETVAGWCVQLATLFGAIVETVPKKQNPLFTAPYAFLDLDGALRVGFDAGVALHKKADERRFVFAIGDLVRAHVEKMPGGVIGRILERCLDPKPSARPTLERLERECRELAREDPVRVGDRQPAWDLIEEAIGWLTAGETTLARRRFQAASIYPYYEEYSRWGLHRTREESVIVRLGAEVPPIRPPPFGKIAWPPTPKPQAPSPPPSPARVAYLDGKQHFLARRLRDAHECFQRAIALDPLMLEAQLLAREVERALARLRQRVGTAVAPVIELPASVSALRGTLLSGNSAAAIAALSVDEYADDPDAQLLRARFCAFDAQHARALELYTQIAERWPSHAANVGIAIALLDLDRADDALDRFDALLSERPRDLDALDGRARSLERLGRTEEAAAAMRDYMAIIEVGSDLRVRLAQR